MAKRVVKVSDRVARPVSELPWLRRKLALRSARKMLRLAPVEGLLTLDAQGRPVWADGYPASSETQE